MAAFVYDVPPWPIGFPAPPSTFGSDTPWSSQAFL
jgi:hypothetical protein